MHIIYKILGKAKRLHTKSLKTLKSDQKRCGVFCSEYFCFVLQTGICHHNEVFQTVFAYCQK